MRSTRSRRFGPLGTLAAAGLVTLAAAVAPALAECRSANRYSPNRMFVFDASGSMEKWVVFPTYTRLGLARELTVAVTTRLMTASRSPTRAGLLTFGARESDGLVQPASCRDIRLDIPLGSAPDVFRRIGATVGTVEPKGGATSADGGKSPLFDAITAAGRAFPPGEGGNIVIVTDMERNETCLPPDFARYDQSAFNPPAQRAIVCRALDAAFAASGQPRGALRIQFVVGPGLVDDRDRTFLDQLAACADAKVKIVTPSSLQADADEMAGQIVDCVAPQQRQTPPPPPDRTVVPDGGQLRLHLVPSELPPELGPEAFDPAPLGLRIEWMWRNTRQKAEVKGIDVPISTPSDGTTTFSVVDGGTTVTSAAVATTAAGGQVAIAVPLGTLEASLAGPTGATAVRWEFARGSARIARRGSTTIRQNLPPGEWKVRAVVIGADGRETAAEGAATMRLGSEHVDLRLDAPAPVVEEVARLRFAGVFAVGATRPSALGLELSRSGGDRARLGAGEERTLTAGDWTVAIPSRIDSLPSILRLAANDRATFDVLAPKARLRGDAPSNMSGEARWTLVDTATGKTTDVRGPRLDLVVDPGDYDVVLSGDGTERRQRVVARAEQFVVVRPR